MNLQVGVEAAAGYSCSRSWVGSVEGSGSVLVYVWSKTPNPKPQTRNSKPYTLYPINPKPYKP